MIAITGVNTATGAVVSKSVIAGMDVLVNGRVLTLAADSDYFNEADRQWVEQTVTIWRDAMQAANPKTEKLSAAGIAGNGPTSGNDGNGCRVEVKVGEPIISVSMSDTDMKKTAFWVILGSIVLGVIWISQRKMGMQ
jgi:hypothetical protein